MCLAEQRHAHRQPAVPVQDVLDGGDVIEDLTDIAAVVSTHRLGFEQHQLGQGRLRPLDPARQHGLATQQALGEKVRVGHGVTGAGQHTEGASSALGPAIE